MKPATIKTQSKLIECGRMIAELVIANKQVINSLENTNKQARSAGEAGLCNLLESRIDAHKKWGWMLAAHLQEK